MESRRDHDAYVSQRRREQVLQFGCGWRAAETRQKRDRIVEQLSDDASIWLRMESRRDKMGQDPAKVLEALQFGCGWRAAETSGTHTTRGAATASWLQFGCGWRAAET